VSVSVSVSGSGSETTGLSKSTLVRFGGAREDPVVTFDDAKPADKAAATVDKDDACGGCGGVGDCCCDNNKIGGASPTTVRLIFCLADIKASLLCELFSLCRPSRTVRFRPH
jgi:hypothetical protein